MQVPVGQTGDARRPVGLRALATATSPHELEQSAVAAAAERLFAPQFPGFARMAGVFGTAGIRTRQSVLPMEWYLQPRGWPERIAAYLEGAVELFVQAAALALDEAGLSPGEVDIVVSVSSTGIATPSLEARAMTRLGLRPDVARVPLFGLGCAGGATGLATASRLAAGSPGAVVLFVCVETCSLAFRTESPTKADIVATALFGDGAAACVLTAGHEGFAEIEATAEHTWPDTLDIMGWRVEPTGLGVIFAKAIPPFVRAELRPVMDDLLARQGLTTSDIDRFVCHPGGAKVIESLEGALELNQGALDAEREVLSDHGNMSAPTVLFVLDKIRKRGLPHRSMMLALGPGFTASTLTLAA